MNFRILFVLIFFFIKLEYINGQVTTVNGYIISNTSDTIFGRIEYSANMGFYDKCVFIREDSTDINIYRPNQIQQFYISNSANFVTKTVKGKKRFLKVLVKGKISLYETSEDLFITDDSDSLITLRGGTETIKANGKYYSRKDELYKIQLKRCIKDTSYFSRIDHLPFIKRNISALINEVDNNQNSGPIENGQMNKSGSTHYGLEFGSFSNTFLFNTSKYNSNWPVKYEDSSPSLTTASDFKDHLSFIYAGFSLKKKMAATNSYLNLTISYGQNVNTSSIRKGIVFNGITFPSNGSAYYDTAGYVTETYNYKIKTIAALLSYYGEISYRRVRPFMGFGVSGSFFVDRRITLDREIIFSDESVQNELLNPDFFTAFL